MRYQRDNTFELEFEELAQDIGQQIDYASVPEFIRYLIGSLRYMNRKRDKELKEKIQEVLKDF